MSEISVFCKIKIQPNFRLENTNKLRRDDTKKFIMGIDSEEFAISILTELVKALLRAAERAIQVG